MGLDMYLYRETFVGGNHEYRDVQGTVELSYNTDDNERLPINVDIKSLVSVTEHLLYWRKANAIHGWFVRNVQGGNDDCKEYVVRRSDLEELWQICNEILNIEDKEKRDDLAYKLLPPTTGFFFGTYTLDEYYFSDLEKTKTVLGKELESPKTYDISYKYQASW